MTSRVRDLTGRLGLRRQLDRRRRTRLLLAVAGVLVLGGVLLWVVAYSPALPLRTVRVSGTGFLTPDEVIGVAAAPMGAPLAQVNERQIADRVAQLPEVAQVTVRRAWPSTVEIRLVERVPVFAVGEPSGATLVDAAGVSFSGAAPAGLIQGTGPVHDSRLLADVATVVRALPPALRDQSVRVVFVSADAIAIEIEGDREVFFGSADEAQFKAEVALALVRGTPAKHIDVSAPTRPSTR